jgi:hypothetical protein
MMATEHEALEAALVESSALHGSVQRLTDAMLSVVHRDAVRWRRATAIVAILALVSSWGWWQQQVKISRGVTCLLEELADHRTDNHVNHEILGNAHGVALPAVPALPKPPPVEKILRDCRPFYGSDR